MELINNKSNHFSLVVGSFNLKFVPVLADILTNEYGYNTFDRPVLGNEFIAWDMSKGKSMISICQSSGELLQIQSLSSKGDSLLKNLLVRLPAIIIDSKYDEFRT
jgi:hypothetical protein